MGAAPKGARRALTHGIYSQFYTDEELIEVEGLRFGLVDAELKLCRIRLLRCLKVEADWLDDPTSPLELGEEVMEGRKTRTGKFVGSRTTRRFFKTNYQAIIDQQLRRIESLEKTRLELMQGAGGTLEDQPITAIKVQIVRWKNPEPSDDGATGEVLSTDG